MLVLLWHGPSRLSLRRGEAEVVAWVRGALEASRFEEVFAARFRLNPREAVAAVRDQHSGAATAPEPWPRPRSLHLACA